eukprot:4615799-Prymnesium_polylepis.1
MAMAQVSARTDPNDITVSSIGSQFAVMDCDDLTDPVWRRSILVRTEENQWQLWDDTNTKIVECQSHQGDHGAAAEFGMYYKFASEEIVRS